ncbi:metalloregulator ArsR/SmtB family transcription factor [Rheinheimera soli]|jgi:ArsR family transcriptional regulator|uniref:ArsR family transcriptional regulator n=1 Tax=Rheinheimera soli TaxID=443616 RepID=A0ABU1VZ41_9GAMM|nr:metalloregulator ArsR/SmtB family transcription factor [Rheinheimera soli]MDR7120835.1 ArsR family transcriptional regulator [Rheinheimera soli]
MLLEPVTFFKALSDETRLRCLLLIQQEQELCVCELVAALADNQPKISRHLAQLRRDGILLDRKQGLWVYYRLNPQLPDWALLCLQQTAAANSGWLALNQQQLCQMGDRPERQKGCC